jgi:hypothetical protein
LVQRKQHVDAFERHTFASPLHRYPLRVILIMMIGSLCLEVCTHCDPITSY